MRRLLFWGGALALVIGALGRLRPARVANARVTAITQDSIPSAQLALRYTWGARPVSVIVDARGQAGGAGSATISGWQTFLEVPIVGPTGGAYQVTTTASYRILGFLYTHTREFGAADVPPKGEG